MAAAAAEDVYEVSWLRVLEAVPKGIGQVYLADNTVSGTAITVGLAICSPTSALMAVLGSVLGTATGLLMQAPLESVYLGLWGYNAVLGCMAIGGMFFYPTKSAFVLASLCAVMCAFVGGALGTMFTPSGLPTLTLPFCLGTLAFALLQDSVPTLVPVPLDEVSTPEEHARSLVQLRQALGEEKAKATGEGGRESAVAEEPSDPSPLPFSPTRGTISPDDDKRP